MYLNAEEEKRYNGEYGWAYEVSMKILVRLGDLFDATKLIPIRSAHVSGVSYKTLGDAPIEFLEALAAADGQVKAPATLNPSSFDNNYLIGKFPQECREKQTRILELYRKMGFNLTLTCTPYYIDAPKPGSHLAWAESSAVVYANSVLNAWTNREGGPSAVAAALIGKVPNYGLHLAENREPNMLVHVRTALKNESEFGALGVHVGKILKDEIPVFEGIGGYSDDDLKQLGAALASAGMTNMFHLREKRSEFGCMERISVDRRDIENVFESLSTASFKFPDLVFLGCPHCSLNEIRKIAGLIRNRKVKEGVELWICTSRHVRQKAKQYVDMIEKAGGHVLCDTCAVVTWTKQLKINSLMTNSAKTAYYAPTLNNADTILASLEKCLEVACKS